MDNKKDDATTQQPQNIPDKQSPDPAPHDKPENEVQDPGLLKKTPQKDPTPPDSSREAPESPQQDKTPKDSLENTAVEKPQKDAISNSTSSTEDTSQKAQIGEKTPEVNDSTLEDPSTSHTPNVAKNNPSKQFGNSDNSAATPPPGNTPPHDNKTQPPQDQPKKSFSKWILALLVVLVVVLVGVGAYAMLMPQKPDPTPIPTPAPTQPEPTPTPEENEQTVLSEEIDLSFSIPLNWEHTSNITSEDIATDYGSGVVSPNEYATNNNGCAIYFGDVLGMGGPSNVLTNESTTIDGVNFNQRAWYREDVNETPFFMYISAEDNTSDYPSIWAWLPEDETSQACMDDINNILSTVEFTDEESEEDTNAQIGCLENGGTWLTEHNECEEISKQQCTQLEGTYNNCASQCRHEPEGTVCTEVCVQVCTFPTNTSNSSM